MARSGRRLSFARRGAVGIGEAEGGRPRRHCHGGQIAHGPTLRHGAGLHSVQPSNHTMTGLDIAVGAIVALSTLFAFARGVVRELIAIASWIVGVVAAFTFGREVAEILPGMDASPVARQVLAFALIFVVVLIVGALIAFLLAKLVRAVGLGFVDRFLGAVFGLARGALVVLILVLLAGLTTLPQQDWWQNATLAPTLADAALSLRPWLPPAWADRLDYSAGGKPARRGGVSA